MVLGLASHCIIGANHVYFGTPSQLQVQVLQLYTIIIAEPDPHPTALVVAQREVTSTRLAGTLPVVTAWCGKRGESIPG